MKKIIATILATIAACATMCFSACKPVENVKVLKDILLTEEDYAFAIAKGNSALLSTVNGLLAEWDEDGSMETLINSYFDGEPTFTYTNKTSSPQADDFVMATNAAFPPFEYKLGNKFTGIDVEIAFNIATELGKDLFVYDMDFNAIINSVKTGQSDIGMAGMTVRPDRLEQVNFANPYYTSAQVLTVLKSDTTFDDCQSAAEVIAILESKSSSYKVGTQTGTTGYMYATNDYDETSFNFETKSYKTGALAIKDLQNKKINAVILDLQPSLMIAQSVNR